MKYKNVKISRVNRPGRWYAVFITSDGTQVTRDMRRASDCKDAATFVDGLLTAER